MYIDIYIYAYMCAHMYMSLCVHSIFQTRFCAHQFASARFVLENVRPCNVLDASGRQKLCFFCNYRVRIVHPTVDRLGDASCFCFLYFFFFLMLLLSSCACGTVVIIPPALFRVLLNLTFR